MEVRDMIADGVLRPRIDSVWKFEEIVEASKQISERKNIGKVIIKPWINEPFDSKSLNDVASYMHVEYSVYLASLP